MGERWMPLPPQPFTPFHLQLMANPSPVHAGASLSGSRPIFRDCRYSKEKNEDWGADQTHVPCGIALYWVRCNWYILAPKKRLGPRKILCHTRGYIIIMFYNVQLVNAFNLSNNVY